MFATIGGLIAVDRDYAPRARRLDIMRRVLGGTLYDVLPYEFHEERGAGGEYIPLRNRRPSVRYPLARIVTEDSLALVFSAGHFPTIDSDDHGLREALQARAGACGRKGVMLDAGLLGGAGAVAGWA